MSILNQILKFPNRRRREIGAVVKSLLRIKGEASAIKLAHEVLQRYTEVDGPGQLAFFRLLRDELGPDKARLGAAIAAYQSEPGGERYLELLDAVEPSRQELIRILNWAPHGTSSLIRMRADLLQHAREDATLKLVDYDFRHLLASWFNRGFLELRRIDWNTPAFILEKLIHYESVHEITDWADLRRRLASDRRCFAFFHPQLPDEPLIFVEVALTRGLVTNIDDVLRDSPPEEDDDAPDSAIFYSINNCQVGLQGISFGNFLIKQVADELAEEIPSLKHFATLSPIPGLRRWFDPIWRAGLDERFKRADYAALAALDQPQWWRDADAAKALKPVLMKACARYLLDEKRGDEPADPVARFHLSNGARIEQIDWLGDTSGQRLQQSYGILVNYVYDRRAVIKNHEAYVAKGRIAASSAVTDRVK
ncbi:MAG: malonyl-CoA decarboxylase [Gammaproteobacteria bacterium]